MLFRSADDLGSEIQPVRIHHAAWQGISPILRSITVKAVKPTASASHPRASDAPSLSSGSRRLSSQKRISVVGSTPLRVGKGSPIVAPPTVERQSLSARKAPVGTPSPRPSSVYAPIVDAGPSSVKSSPPSARSIQPPLPSTSKIEELEDDDEDEEVRILSSPKKRGVRPRIMSDYGIEDAAEDDDSPATEVTQIGEDFDQLEEEGFASAGPSGSESRTQLSRSGSGSLVELDGHSSGSSARKAERSSSVRHLDGE